MNTSQSQRPQGGGVIEEPGKDKIAEEGACDSKVFRVVALVVTELVKKMA